MAETVVCSPHLVRPRVWCVPVSYPHQQIFGSASRKCGKGGKLVPVGRRSKVGGIIVPVSFWEVSLTRPNFLVLKAEKFAPPSRQKCAQP
ncbi:hypothetical protein [Okeania sp. KiyG1]|uniref:hypothetical protein n=1 Tax=Okeania sp. KiyG1 TaxID=2720165 RepID=UPI0019213907|nr:hypothetical protein [Okeania sp. KiyG1]